MSVYQEILNSLLIGFSVYAFLYAKRMSRYVEKTSTKAALANERASKLESAQIISQEKTEQLSQAQARLASKVSLTQK